MHLFAIIDDGLCVRSRKDGDAYRFGKVTRKLKKLFIDDKIPSAKRSLIPIVSFRDDVLWVFGYGSDERFRPKVGEKALYLNFKPF